MRRGLVCIVFLSLLAFPVYGQAPKPGLKIDDLNQLVRVGDPQVSPDGKQIVYTVSRVDTEDDKSVSELWMVDWDGSNNLQLTYGTESASSPKWSPDGRYLAFTSSRPGKAKGTQVWVLDRRGGEARQATDVKQDLSDFRWSPDAKQLVLTLREKDEPESDDKNAKPKPPKPVVIDRYHFKQDIEGYLTDKHPQLYLFDIATKKLSKLTSSPASGTGSYEEHEAEWSPDGAMIAFVSNQSQPDPDRVENDDVFVVDAKPGSAARKLTTFPGEDHGPLAWSPDSKLIAYRQGLSEHYTAYGSTRLAAVPARGGQPELKATSIDNNVGPPVFTADGKSLLTTVTDDRVVYVEEVPLAGGAPKRLTEETGTASGLAAAGGHVSLLWSTDAADPEIYSLDASRLRKLTAHNDALLAQRTLATTEDIAAKSKDGTDVHGLLTMPVGYQAGTKAPMLLFIHGGPTAQDEHRFTVDRQLFASHGFAVLNVNYRGSAGRGHEYSETISADWGDKEVADLLAVVDAAVATGKIDAERMVVGGWSYGGISTDYLIASTTRFKAASSGAGTANLFGMYGADEYILQYDNELGPPWKNPERYIKLSYPFFHVERIKTPTLFMGGDKDFNVTLIGGEQMYQALKSVGVPAELIVYPGQFHGFTRPSFIRDRYERWFAWYDKYLGIKPAATK
jgi:dipeptidyl aminopeptidase/acylaminoacyl peptidase